MAAIWAAIKAPFARAIAFFVLAFARFGAIKAAIWAAIIAPFFSFFVLLIVFCHTFGPLFVVNLSVSDSFAC
jgi:hypothetical protein